MREIKFKGLAKQSEPDRILKIPPSVKWIVGHFIQDYSSVWAIYPFKEDLRKEKNIHLESIVPDSQCQYLLKIGKDIEIYEYDIIFNKRTNILFYFYFNKNHQIAINNISVTTGLKSTKSKLINNKHYSTKLSTDIYHYTGINYKEILIQPISNKIIENYIQYKKSHYFKKFEYKPHQLHIQLRDRLNIPISKSRKAEIINLRRAFCAIMQELGYNDKYISMLLGIDRTTVLYHIYQHKYFTSHNIINNNNYHKYHEVYKELKSQVEAINQETKLRDLEVKHYYKEPTSPKQHILL